MGKGDRQQAPASFRVPPSGLGRGNGEGSLDGQQLGLGRPREQARADPKRIGTSPEVATP